MFFKKFLLSFTFFRKRAIRKIRERIEIIKQDFHEGFFNDRYIADLHSILEEPVIRFKEEFVLGSTEHINTYSNSSMSLLRAIKKHEVRMTSLDRSVEIKQLLETKPFSHWYSNEGSIVEFVETMRELVAVKVILNRSEALINGETSVIVDVGIEEMLESRLYRLLLIDLVTIVDHYLEKEYDHA